MKSYYLLWRRDVIVWCILEHLQPTRYPAIHRQNGGTVTKNELQPSFHRPRQNGWTSKNATPAAISGASSIRPRQPPPPFAPRPTSCKTGCRSRPVADPRRGRRPPAVDALPSSGLLRRRRRRCRKPAPPRIDAPALSPASSAPLLPLPSFPSLSAPSRSAHLSLRLISLRVLSPCRFSARTRASATRRGPPNSTRRGRPSCSTCRGRPQRGGASPDPRRRRDPWRRRTRRAGRRAQRAEVDHSAAGLLQIHAAAGIHGGGGWIRHRGRRAARTALRPQPASPSLGVPVLAALRFHTGRLFVSHLLSLTLLAASILHSLSAEIDRIKKENDNMQIELRHLKGEDLNSLQPKELIMIDEALDNGLTNLHEKLMEHWERRMRNNKMLEDENKLLAFKLHQQDVALSGSMRDLELGYHPDRDFAAQMPITFPVQPSHPNLQENN